MIHPRDAAGITSIEPDDYQAPSVRHWPDFWHGVIAGAGMMLCGMVVGAALAVRVFW